MVEKYTSSEGGMRLDVFLSEKSGKSRSHIKNLLEKGNILVNEKKEKCSYILKTGDQISLLCDEEDTTTIKPVNIPIDIVYEDDDLVVVNKPQGLTVHAGNGTDENTLVNALLFSIDHLSSINGDLRPGIVHRIDKETSGLLLVAKNDKAHLNLAKQIEEKSCHRCYLALLSACPKEESGRIDTYIDRSKKDRTKFTVPRAKSGKRAITDYKVQKRYCGGYTLCEFILQTGRTHQIRVHSKYMGCPVVGDKVYGAKKQKFNLEGQLLHAYKITFNHPSTGKEMTFTCPLPSYFQNVLDELKEL